MNHLLNNISYYEQPNLKITKELIGLEFIEEWNCCKQLWQNYEDVLEHVKIIHSPINIFDKEFKCQQCSYYILMH